jgi:hypothetical protein
MVANTILTPAAELAAMNKSHFPNESPNTATRHIEHVAHSAAPFLPAESQKSIPSKARTARFAF